MGRVNRFYPGPGTRRFARVKHKGSITKHTPAALLAVSERKQRRRRVIEFGGSLGLADSIFRNTSMYVIFR